MRKKLTYREFIERSNKIFNFAYDYTKFVYVDNCTKGIIICPLHGEFLQKPKNHMNGQRCAGCTNNKKLTTSTFITKANYIHENKYDYSLAAYGNSYSKMKIICPLHGLFEQRANNHLLGAGCPKCRELRGEKLIRSWLTKNKLEFDSQYTIFGCKNERSLIFDFAIFDKQKLVGLIEYVTGTKPTSLKMQMKDEIKANYCKTHNIPLLIISYDEVAKINMILKEFVVNKPN